MKATMSFKDKLIDYRNRYRKLKGKETKGNFLSRLTDTFGFDRKCLIKLLNGQRDFKPPRGRGRTYGKTQEGGSRPVRAIFHRDASTSGQRLGGRAWRAWRESARSDARRERIDRGAMVPQASIKTAPPWESPIWREQAQGRRPALSRKRD